MVIDPLPLTAGPVSMVFQAHLGFLRHVRVGDVEIVRGVYAAVRDENWGTYHPELQEVVHAPLPDGGFELTWRSTCADLVEWHGRLVGRVDGTVVYEAVAKILRDFDTNRTGVCLLHPAKESAGLPCVVHHTDGSEEHGQFPSTISPHQPFFDIAEIAHPLPGGGQAEICFDGEVYEMEDQRNWSDASFKTYPRPHAWPKPYALKAGDDVRNCIEIRLLKAPSLPKIGLLASDAPFNSLAGVRDLGLDHIGVTVDAGNPDWRESLAQQLDVADAVGAPVQLYVRGPLPDKLPEELRPIEVVLADVGEGPWSEERVANVARRFPGIPIVASSADNFTELNRSCPPADGLAGFGFGVNPQVHAFDDLSIVEATETLAILVRDARQLGLPWVSVGPLTLEPRLWGQRPPDPRLATPFHAVWLLASLRNLVAGGADRVTLGFTHGPRGIASNPEILQLLTYLLSRKWHAATAVPAPEPLVRQSLRLGNQIVTADFEQGTVIYGE
jgi:hypothetical protein